MEWQAAHDRRATLAQARPQPILRPERIRRPDQCRLEALRGDRRGQWSIRINEQWRICFRWEQGEAFDVEIVDYH